eukprot:gene121-114_t
MVHAEMEKAVAAILFWRKDRGKLHVLLRRRADRTGGAHCYFGDDNHAELVETVRAVQSGSQRGLRLGPTRQPKKHGGLRRRYVNPGAAQGQQTLDEWLTETGGE